MIWWLNCNKVTNGWKPKKNKKIKTNPTSSPVFLERGERVNFFLSKKTVRDNSRKEVEGYFRWLWQYFVRFRPVVVKKSDGGRRVNIFISPRTFIMENIQINGQKIWGPPKGWVGPPPPHGTEIFIKNIPDDVFEDELYYLFSRVGKVYEVRLPVHWTGTNKGYAFVRFTDVAGADAAIERLNGCPIRDGRQLKVERSLDNTRLFLSAVPNDKSGEEIKADLQTVVDNVKTVYVYPALENPSTFRGYAFVEFECHRDAAIAKRVLTPDILFNLFERKCVAAWANPLPFLSKETLRSINILFMRNIPSHVKSISIRMGVDSLISPDSVHKVKRLNDYAFLTFKNHDIAERAMMKIKCNPFLFGVKAVHIEWAIPRELANSLAAKDGDSVKENKSEYVYGANLENYYPDLKTIKDYNGHCPDFLFENHMNLKNIDVDNENIPFGLLPNNSNIRILQRAASEFDSFSIHNKTEADMNFHQNIRNDSKEISPLHLANAFNKSNYSIRSNQNDESFITEYRHSDSENYCRDVHLKNWLQSLTLADQYESSATSPTLTSPSTDSSNNLSWKLDESNYQFSSGRRTPMGYDSKDFHMKTNPKNFQQIVLF